MTERQKDAIKTEEEKKKSDEEKKEKEKLRREELRRSEFLDREKEIQKSIRVFQDKVSYENDVLHFFDLSIFGIDFPLTWLTWAVGIQNKAKTNQASSTKGHCPIGSPSKIKKCFGGS